MSHNEIKARHERVAKGTTWDFNFTDGQLANKDRGELLKILSDVKIEVEKRVARGDFIRYQHLQAILEDKP